MKSSLTLSAFFGLLAFTILHAPSANAAPHACQGYFSSKTTYTVTDFVTTDIDPAEVTPILDENGDDMECLTVIEQVLKEGGLRIGQQDVTVIMKVMLHPEETEILMPQILDFPNPAALKITFKDGVDTDGIPAFFVQVSR